jgi:predicted dehydrogenase
MNGVTGRMGTNQHLVRSILAIRKQGGVVLANGDTLIPEPILIGRNQNKLQALAEAHGVEHWSTDLDRTLADSDAPIYFDAQTTAQRVASVRKAIAAGKHIYCEKPIGDSLEDALSLARLAQQAGVKHGVVQDKLFLPGLIKLKRLIDSGFFGRILSVRGEFGYWVFEGDLQAGQRPSWNYRSEDGGGIIIDMLCHWRYVLDNLFGAVRSVSCFGATHIPTRVDEQGRAYDATADDAAYATFLLDDNLIAQINSSWCVRVYRDELFVLQVDGTHGSAVAGLRECRIQHRGTTPRPVWNPDIPNPIDFRAGWQEVPDNMIFENGFKIRWELFLRHIADGAPFRWGFLEGAKGVQLAELGLQSWRERRWVDVPDLTV